MLRLKQRLSWIKPTIHSTFLNPLAASNPSQWTSIRFFDFYQLGNKEAIEKERARLTDEMNRGYFADISELKKHGGKISEANKIIIPAIAAVKFPALDVTYSDGTNLSLPTVFNAKGVDPSTVTVPNASLMCLSFRASSQTMVNTWTTPFLDAFSNSKAVQLYETMVNTWTTPFLDAFSNSKAVQLYEVSFIDSWLLTRSPIKKLLLRMMRKPDPKEKKDVLQRQIVYFFGDHYYFRKDLKILNLLTGYIFLLDKSGRIRWQGSGVASKEELASLLACTSLLLEEN